MSKKDKGGDKAFDPSAGGGAQAATAAQTNPLGGLSSIIAGVSASSGSSTDPAGQTPDPAQPTPDPNAAGAGGVQSLANGVDPFTRTRGEIAKPTAI